MAFAGTFIPIGGGRLPGLPGVTKVPGPEGLKVKFGRFTADTDYPAGGYAASDLETICGFTRIEFAIPLSPMVDNSAEDGFYVAWNGDTRTLQIFGLAEVSGNNDAPGIAAAGIEASTGLNTLSDAYVDLMVAGY